MESRFETQVVAISERGLDPAAALDFVADPAFGGINMFVGKVRDFNHGRVVSGISYDIYKALAENMFAEICREAELRWGPKLKLHVSHACGRLGIGDLAVVVAAGTPHRDEAFQACRYVIEAVKHRAPIWKQEHFVDGDSEWSLGCSLCGDEHDHSHQDHQHAAAEHGAT